MRLVIASRQSDLARIQAYAVGEALLKKHPHLNIEYFFRESLGDKNLNDPLWKMPERGVFTEDFYQGLLQGEWDMVVHSWKDLPVETRPGTEILATLPREDVRDILLLKKTAVQKKQLRILTSSPRRNYNLSLHLKELLPAGVEALVFEPVRGNVQTRVRKLIEGELDGLIVAKAALDRLLSAQRDEFAATKIFLRQSLQVLQWMILPITLNPTAAAQGALAVETRQGREDLKTLFAGIHCPTTYSTVQQERHLLKSWGGGCHQKIGVNVLRRPYGTVFFARGVRDSGEIIEQRELRDSSAPVLRGKPFLGRPEWFLRQTLHQPLPNLVAGSTAHWVTRGEALPAQTQVSLDDVIWTSGLKTWKSLALRGLWVNGSSESLGESEDPRLEALDSVPRRWIKWTHSHGEPLAFGSVVSTYELLPKNPSPELDSSCEHFFWSSGSSFLQALKIAPWLLEKTNWSGPGHTHQILQNALGPNRAAHVALDYEEWQKRFQQGS